MIHILDFVLSLIYPNVCGFCGKINQDFLCSECKDKIKDKLLYKIDEVNDKYFDKHIYLVDYEGIFREYILSYKFFDKSYMYKTFAKLILKNEKVYGIINSYDIICPVPIHKKRENERGYNQSELIAKELARKIPNIEYKNLLTKVKNTPKQSSLSMLERIENVKNVYEIQNRQIIDNKKIVLFDDIYTTGNTANECSRILKENNAKEVLVLSLAK